MNSVHVIDVVEREERGGASLLDTPSERVLVPGVVNSEAVEEGSDSGTRGFLILRESDVRQCEGFDINGFKGMGKYLLCDGGVMKVRAVLEEGLGVRREEIVTESPGCIYVFLVVVHFGRFYSINLPIHQASSQLAKFAEIALDGPLALEYTSARLYDSECVIVKFRLCTTW